jgi:hypothetical protein
MNIGCVSRLNIKLVNFVVVYNVVLRIFDLDITYSCRYNNYTVVILFIHIRNLDPEIYWVFY